MNTKERFEKQVVGKYVGYSDAEDVLSFFRQELLALAEEVDGLHNKLDISGAGAAALIRSKADELK